MTHDSSQKNKIVEFCSLVNKNSLFDLLCEDFKLSKASLKKIKKSLKREVRIGDILEVPIQLINMQMVSPSFNSEKPELLYEDRDLVVMNKPYNLHGHPLDYSDNKNVISFLRSELKDKTLGLPSPSQERGLLYRLDYVTSGVLVYFKGQKDVKELRSQISEKKYLAIVEGNFNINRDCFQYFTPSGVKGSKMKVSSSRGEFEGKMSVGKISFNSVQNLSLVEVGLVTGIRHQIRSGLSDMGFPILGDELYGGKKCARVYLHAYQYSFEFNREKKTFIAEKAFLFDLFFNLNSIL